MPVSVPVFDGFAPTRAVSPGTGTHAVVLGAGSPPGQVLLDKLEI
jgi:hypothetical protein